MEIKEKYAIVTGGASGFGLRLTERLSQGGCRVAVLDIDPLRLQALKNKLPDVLGIACDVGNAQQVAEAVDAVYRQFGRVDILINNAGIMKSAPLVNPLAKDNRRHPVDLWRQVMDVNLNAVFYVTSHVAERMIQERNKGVIVNISSIAAHGNSGQSAYAASKAGVEALTKVWAKELGRLGIRCAAVAPGFADTQGTADALEQETLARWVGQVPLRRLGSIDEIVDGILFIIANDFINGRVIGLDGGLVI